MMNLIKKMLTLSLVTVSGLTSLFASDTKLPNILLILNDDQGYQDLGCYGSPDIRTPNVDALAAEGMRFTDLYVASPVCSASRAAIQTGRYPYRVGVPGVFFPNRGVKGLSPEHLTIAEVLKSVGYATKAVGKWHLGDEVQFLPTNQGYDSYYGIPYSNDMTPAKSMKYSADCVYLEGVTPELIEQNFKNVDRKKKPRGMKDKVPLMRDEECIEFPANQSTITRRYADEGIRFISKCVKAEQPFFLYLANSMPHTPLFASKDFAGKSPRGLYGDVIEEIDFNVGRILTHLKTTGIEKNTIVIFTSDNGPWLIKGKHGGSALPLFEGKMTSFEGGQRVPAIVKWPGHVPAGSTCSEMALSMDLLPTLAHITGASLPAEPELDGKNVIDLWTAKSGAKTPHKYFFFVHNAVRSGDWKYHKKELFKVKATMRDTKAPTLYNLKTDIGESRNVIAEHPEIAEQLSKALEAHIQATPKTAK